jgi:serpin B
MTAHRPPRATALLASLLLLIGACASDPTAPATLSALPRPLTDSEQAIGSAGNGFSFDLLRQINLDQRGSNVFVSPLSASMALGMTLNGAAGATADEMRRALGFGDASRQAVNEGYRGLIGLLRGLDRSTELRVANAIFYRNDFPFEEAFLETGRTWFDAEIGGLDFAAPASVATINDWVSRSTNAKIPAIIDDIDQGDVMFLINAVYFKGTWRSRFDPRATADASFHAIDGESEPVKLMYQKSTLRYLETPDFQAADLLYGNSAFAMTVILPVPGKDVNDIVGTVSAASWADWTGRFTEKEIELHLPKLKLAYERTMNDDLKALGIDLAFRPGMADFTGMSPLGHELFITEVRQKTFVDIHEEGTEAAAATVVAVGPTSMPVIPEMRVDRPFVFAIRERFSGTILFIGKIVRMPVPET